MNKGMIGLIGIIVAVVAIIWIISAIFIKKRKAEVWEGVVSDKREKEVWNDNNKSVYYIIAIALDNGTRKEIQVNRKLWNTFSAGDRVIKRAGEYNPVKA